MTDDPYRDLREAAEQATSLRQDLKGFGKHVAAILALLAERERLAEAVAYGEIGINAHREREAELEERAGRLAEALTPFAREADAYDPVQNDDDDWLWAGDQGPLTLGDLRRARAALAKEATDG